jgi:hypothetical protein
MGDNLELNLMAAASLDEKRAAQAVQEQALQAKVAQLQHHLAIVSAALNLLGVRAFTFLALIGGLTMFGLAVTQPDTARTLAAATYAALVFLPTIYLTRGKLQGE